ncbi:hypothetical protein [Massilia sp. Bi118]|uniref:hypothetical protein n=1 Tax=Massilia sp. Bi118 TaxID=2822346 RepID=UPI001E2C4AB5|nr:hypothetical protein [Massilia sp. Bi118]
MLILLMMNDESCVGRKRPWEYLKPGCAQHKYSYIRHRIIFIFFFFNDLHPHFHDAGDYFSEWKWVSLPFLCNFHIRELYSAS